MTTPSRRIAAATLTATLVTTAGVAAANNPVPPSPAPATFQAPLDPTRLNQPQPVTGPHVTGNKTTARYDYAAAIRESVKIPAGFDSDNDGTEDTISVDIIRPKEAADAGHQVPVIIVPSPYFTGPGRGPTQDRKEFDDNGALIAQPLWYDNFFVPRGYAVATVDGIGTSRSTGCTDVGGPRDIASLTKTIDWLNGRATASYVSGGDGAATADWSTGNAAAIGKSYDGTIAMGAAATGVEGLRTIVPLAGISSWYSYTRISGVPRINNYLGGLGLGLANNQEACEVSLEKLSEDSSEGLGMNPVWEARDYLKTADKITASTLLVTGQYDYNVVTSHAEDWRKATKAAGAPTMLWLNQAKHDDPFDVQRAQWVSFLHGWFDFWLSGLNNGLNTKGFAMTEPAVGDLRLEPSWPVGRKTTYDIAGGVLGEAGSELQTLVGTERDEEELLADLETTSEDRLVFRSQPLTEDLRISGSPQLRLRIRTNGKTVPLAARLIDDGPGDRFDAITEQDGEDCWGDSTENDSACYPKQGQTTKEADYALLTRGWANAEFRDGIRNPKPVPAGDWVDVTVPMMMTDNIIKQGNRVTLVLAMNETRFPAELTADAPIEIDMARSGLDVTVDKPHLIGN